MPPLLSRLYLQPHLHSTISMLATQRLSCTPRTSCFRLSPPKSLYIFPHSTTTTTMTTTMTMTAQLKIAIMTSTRVDPKSNPPLYLPNPIHSPRSTTRSTPFSIPSFCMSGPSRKEPPPNAPPCRGVLMSCTKWMPLRNPFAMPLSKDKPRGRAPVDGFPFFSGPLAIAPIIGCFSRRIVPFRPPNCGVFGDNTCGG